MDTSEDERRRLKRKMKRLEREAEELEEQKKRADDPRKQRFLAADIEELQNNAAK